MAGNEKIAVIDGTISNAQGHTILHTAKPGLTKPEDVIEG